MQRKGCAQDDPKRPLWQNASTLSPCSISRFCLFVWMVVENLKNKPISLGFLLVNFATQGITIGSNVPNNGE